jgi:dimethylargininase
MEQFQHAVVRLPGANFAEGLTEAGLGRPDLALALEQHARYCAALERCGLAVTRLPADPRHPDAPFVEDTAVIAAGQAILTRPGAPSRAGEVESIEAALAPWFPQPARIAAPGTLDGGDVCEAGQTVFIGLSQRTNAEGARQLARWLEPLGYRAVCIDIRGLPGLLHLKSGIAYLGDGRLVLCEALAGRPEFDGFTALRAPADELYAANCLRVNGAVLLPAGYPALRDALRSAGYQVVVLEMSEFQKLDGGLSCLSLRF